MPMFSILSLTMSKNVEGTVIHPPSKIESLDEISLLFISVVPKLSLWPVKRALSEISLNLIICPDEKLLQLHYLY